MELNPSQLAAVNSPAPRLLVVAAAGSGKTRVFVERIKRMIADGIDPASIVAITFTNAAAAEIQKRLDATAWEPRAVNSITHVRPGTTLGFAGTLHSFLLRILQQHGTMIGLPTRLTVLDEAEAEAMLVKVIADMSYKGTRKSVDEAVKLGVDHFRSQCRKPETETERVAWEYFFRLLTTGCLTFDMILSLGLELVKKLATPTQGQYQNLRRFEHVCVDEFQDANALDAEIYEALPVKTRFFCGDARQAIYSFRGGDVNVIRAENNREGTTVLELTANYRSGTEIIRAANKLQTDSTPMVSATGTTGAVTITSHDTAAEEAAAVAQAIKRELAAGTPAIEVAVLVRTNALAAAFRTVLKDSGIPVRERKQADNPLDWKIARAFIALLTNPESDRLAGKFLELKLGTEKAAQMQREATADFTTINERFLHIRNVAVADVTTAMVAAGLGRESIGRVRALVEQLDRNATLLELQGAITELEADNAEETDGVTVTTIHGAKGKEWEAVFLPAWEEGVFPSSREQSGEELSEARRLAYVAVTRAKSLCAISHASRRNKEWIGQQQMTPSRFISELGRDVLDHVRRQVEPHDARPGQPDHQRLLHDVADGGGEIRKSC
jgi:DNA helicase-2/ATP-dependent DNA helicase PcrA